MPRRRISSRTSASIGGRPGRPVLRYEDTELVAQDEDLEVLGPVVVASPDAEAGEPAQDEVQQRQHRRMVEAV